MNRIFFFTSTHFHFFVAVDIIHRCYNASHGYEPIVVQLNRANKPVLDKVNLKEKKDLFEFHEVFYNEFTRDRGGLAPWVNTTQYRAGDTMVVFLEQGFFSVWANYFRPKGVKLVLAPDGNKPYYKVNAKAWPSRIRATFTIYRFLMDFGYLLNQAYFQNLNYGRLRRLDEIWVRFPKRYQGSQQNKVKPFSLFENFDFRHPLNLLYDVQKYQSQLPKKDIILYVNNILYEDELYAEEIKVLRFLNDRYSDKNLYIKYHPSTPESQLQRFSSLSNVSMLSVPVPVELLIQNLENAIVIGMWSTGLMIDNPRCNFYWLNKYLERQNKMLKRINLTNPTKHIKEVEDLNAIVFPQRSE